MIELSSSCLADRNERLNRSNSPALTSAPSAHTSTTASRKAIVASTQSPAAEATLLAVSIVTGLLTAAAHSVVSSTMVLADAPTSRIATRESRRRSTLFLSTPSTARIAASHRLPRTATLASEMASLSAASTSPASLATVEPSRAHFSDV